MITTNRGQHIELAKPTDGNLIVEVTLTTETGSRFTGFVSRAAIAEGKESVISEVLSAYNMGIMQKVSK